MTKDQIHFYLFAAGMLMLLFPFASVLSVPVLAVKIVHAVGLALAAVFGANFMYDMLRHQVSRAVWIQLLVAAALIIAIWFL